MSVGELLKSPLFWTGIILMICAGASEISMAQWASAFTESALGIEKRMGDLAGPCMLSASIFPTVLIIMLLLIRKQNKRGVE